jgi:hypothetical protein
VLIKTRGIFTQTWNQCPDSAQDAYKQKSIAGIKCEIFYLQAGYMGSLKTMYMYTDRYNIVNIA